MKNLAFYRCLKKPHKEVNDAHDSKMHVNESTLKCELFSNETTKARVLDVLGFFREMTAAQVEAASTIMPHIQVLHLSTMRSILHIQTIMKMKFQCILYFLPCQGPLKIISSALQEELKLLAHYFGKSIFQTIVLVATLDEVTYDNIPEGIDVKFSLDKLEDSRSTFQEVLKKFLPVDTPNPLIIFISLRETCESILNKVKQAEVDLDGLELELTASICARCNMSFGERDGERVAIVECPNWSQRMMHDVDWSEAMPPCRSTQIQSRTEDYRGHCTCCACCCTP